MIQNWQDFLRKYSVSTSSDNQNTIMNLSSFGWLKITGLDAKKFLQGQLTCNLDEITNTESRLGAHCNPKGRMISLFRIFYFKENYYLQMPREMISLALNALKKYAVFFKVQLIDASDEFVCIGYMGHSLNSIIPLLPEKPDHVVASNGLLIFNIPGTLPRYELLGDIETMSELFEKLITKADYLSIEHWKYEDLKEKIPSIYPETSEKFLPHELNLHINNGISFNKGCYTGQEIIARMHYRGQLKTQLVFSTLENSVSPERGYDLPGTHNTIVDFCKRDNNVYAILILMESFSSH